MDSTLAERNFHSDVGSPVCQKNTSVDIVTLSEALLMRIYIWVYEINFIFHFKKQGFITQEYEAL